MINVMRGYCFFAGVFTLFGSAFFEEGIVGALYWVAGGIMMGCAVISSGIEEGLNNQKCQATVFQDGSAVSERDEVE